MKLLLLAIIILTAACTFTISDNRTEPERAATRTARPIQPRDQGRIKIWLKRPPVDIAPALVPPTPTVNLVPTVTPTPKESE